MRNLFQSAEEEFEIRKVFRSSFLPKGYREVNLPVLESYETYESLQTIQNRKSLLKLIDHTGDIFVLRPDVTIPLMRELATTHGNLDEEVRCWYVQSVFRQSDDLTIPTERRQAGIELFSNQSAENDAEVIGLACLALTELGLHDFKIELGHAGILQELIRILQLTKDEQLQVKSFIQMKNSGELANFLQQHNVKNQTKDLLLETIFSYGEATSVFNRFREHPLNNQLSSIIQYIEAVYELVLESGFGNHVTVDLGMVNEMDYYSGIQFQGFSNKIGKPLLMGGRYDEVSQNFGAQLPAVGFACDVEAIFTVKNNSAKTG
ncbi:ATP phosphoribosyltransferase regulatory subunit [Sporosarcina aquimarina]|uniref:ATP phosphoribosyltransferase regulatory subunit n=1 Tax=Sporosarcina aquimarina TaxID=114975 RepID=UPI002042421D|nr:ATP phosphoribosyltransferase regulatory subunit [Sporosarcina aquimarina]MCM3757585.1 ATP phosphoribosyltransferase regulatory subunit [Sporosarcina aquimarina]